MKISFIGAGNVAWHLAQAFEKANHSIVEIYSRDKKNAQKLTEKLYNATPTDRLDFSHSKSELFIISVPDDAIAQVVSELKCPKNSILVHTAGSKNLSVLEPLPFTRKGVFYPLQTFSKGKPIDFKKIPICIEAENETVEKILQKLAFTICDNVCFIESEDRKTLHLAAVFACNFTNHFMHISKNILEKDGLNFNMIKPLIEETISKALSKGPENAQTGPAIRKDTNTINSHIEKLSFNVDWQNLYVLLSKDIQSI
jgi:predicted short-subunit dehydrogenase-like oxidoreductase (DUF2520 family)